MFVMQHRLASEENSSSCQHTSNHHTPFRPFLHTVFLREQVQMLNGPALASCPLFKSPFQPPPLHMHAKLSLGGAFDFLKTNRHDVLVLIFKKDIVSL